MLPVLEDSVLAQRAAEGTLTVKDLLMYRHDVRRRVGYRPAAGRRDRRANLSRCCWTWRAIALRLNKPLIARLMPVPGKKAGDPVEFAFEYFAKGRVLALPAAPLKAGLAGEETLSIKPRGG